jgi:RNA polymerase sigma-70 factor (ECF subfamily)
MAPVAQHADPGGSEVASATLGNVLYPDASKPLVPEADWVALVRDVATGNQLALHGLYERAHAVVFTLALRITRSRETAEEVTLDVFYDVWRRASDYDPANGTVLGWIMMQARSRSLDRLRFEHRRKRVDPDAGALQPIQVTPDALETLQGIQQGEILRRALRDLSPLEREAIETAFFSGLTYAEAAARLNQPLGTIKTRIRSGLQKLRHALSEGGTRA